MNSFDPRLRRREVLLAALAALGGCGGGVDSGGTGSGAPTYSSGAISGFGSIIVGGVRYDETDASIVDDEGRALTSALALGMQTEITASEVVEQAGVARATARTVRVVSQLVGAIDSIDLANTRLVVLGQRVQVHAGTAFDPTINGLAGLAAGQTIEVHASLDAAASRFIASRIDRRDGADRDKLVGFVESLSLTARTVDVGGVTIDWSGVNVAEPERTFAAGRLVRATLAPGSGTRHALTIGSALPPLEDRDRFELEGRISAFVSTASFAVNGIAVDAQAAVFPDGSAGLALGTKVEVKGALRGGVLIASRVEIEDDDDNEAIELHGSIQSVDAAAQRFVVKGVTVAWDAATRFDSSSATDIAVGREVEAKGRIMADGVTVLASTIHVED
jgi:hypothetical protein